MTFVPQIETSELFKCIKDILKNLQENFSPDRLLEYLSSYPHKVPVPEGPIQYRTGDL